MSLLTGGHSSCRPGCFFCPLLQSGQLHKRIRRRKRKIPRVSASASLMRAPVFHSVASAASCGADPGRNGAGAHFRGQQVFWQFIMNHRHLAECQRCRIIDGTGQHCRCSWRFVNRVMQVSSSTLVINHNQELHAPFSTWTFVVYATQPITRFVRTRGYHYQGVRKAWH